MNYFGKLKMVGEDGFIDISHLGITFIGLLPYLNYMESIVVYHQETIHFGVRIISNSRVLGGSISKRVNSRQRICYQFEQQIIKNGNPSRLLHLPLQPMI
jgi:hypothetical protein